jgi:hypothetical protein
VVSFTQQEKRGERNASRSDTSEPVTRRRIEIVIKLSPANGTTVTVRIQSWHRTICFAGVFKNHHLDLLSKRRHRG